MPTSRTPSLFVVDGSNIATEGRSKPSLEQLNEAVLAFMEENPDVEITVVVDATFGHRISKKEVKAFDEAVANNELVTPPAGAIGRGDAFVLSIANKAKAGVLSNDSFQEFHGDYEWLFDEGRLVGGKPVPHVGWVWVSRTPVRGPKSRRSVKEAKDADHTEAKQTANRRVRKKSAASSVEAPPQDAVADEQTSPPEEESSGSTSKSRSGGRRRGGGRGRGGSDTNGAQVDVLEATPPAGGSKDHVNELMPFIDFVEHHPVGTSCTAEVESYASHGAYARTGDVLIYLPLRLLDDPAPRSARSALTIGDSITVVIVGFTPDRRSIDAALPHMADPRVAEAAAPIDAQSLIEDADDEPAPASTDPTPARKSTAKKRAKKSTTKQTSAEQSPAKTAAKKSAAKKTAPKKTAPKKTAPKKTAVKKTAVKKTAVKKSAAEKSPAKKTPAQKTPAKKTPAQKTPAKKSPARKTAAKQTTAKKAAAKKVATKKASARKSGAGRAASSADD